MNDALKREPKAILWVTPKWPFPAVDGARQATCSALKALGLLGENIDLLCFVDKPPSSQELTKTKEAIGIKNIGFIVKSRPFGRFSRLFNLLASTLFLTKLPFTVAPFKVADLNKKLYLSFGQKNWSHIVFDGMHSAVSFLDSASHSQLTRSSKLIYRAHNLEASLWKQAAREASPITKFLIRIQETKIARLEAELSARCAAVAPVSFSDLEKFKNQYRLKIGQAVPIGFDFSQPPPPRKIPKAIKLVYVGSVSWRPNREGIEWFLREIWPQVSKQRPDISLVLAGQGTDSLKAAFGYLKRVKMLGELKKLDSIYLSASACIVPIFSGSGIRVKAVEASRFGRACLSTALGVEGLPLEPEVSYFNAESKEDWIRVLTEIKSEELELAGIKAFQTLKQDFDSLAVGKAILRLLDTV